MNELNGSNEQHNGGYGDDPQDEVEETLRRFGKFVKKTFREASPGDRFTAWINLMVVAVGIAAAVIYWRQLSAMQGQLSEMKASGEQTERLICLYQQQLAQLSKQANDTHDLATAALLNSRAWIGIMATGFGYAEKQGQPRVTGTVVLRNSGPSPAFNIHVWRCGQVRTSEPSTTSAVPPPVEDCIAEDIGTMNREVPVTFNMDDLHQIVPKDSLTASSHDPGPHYFVWGRITYNIYATDKKHFTSFCLLNASSQLGPCKKGNDAD